MRDRTSLVVNGVRMHIDLDLSRWAQKAIYDYLTHGFFYEANTVRALEKILRPGDAFIDVGAHVGYFSLVAAALGASVTCFEPEPENRAGLVHNLVANNINGRVRPFGLGDEDKTRPLFVNLDNDGGHAFWDVGQHPFNTKSKENPTLREVQVHRLDTLAQGFKVNAIKIDTEGSELAVLKGAQETLQANPDAVVICEINRYALAQMGATEEQLRTFMEKGMGYGCWLLEQYPVDGKIVSSEPVRLEFGMTVNSLNVFNVMFRK